MAEEKIGLDQKILEEAANAISERLDRAVYKGNLNDLGSRGAILNNAIGGLSGFLAAINATEALQDILVYVVNSFDQADTGGAIMLKPGGKSLREEIEKLRTILNQQGKVTALSSADIINALHERQKIAKDHEKFIREQIG